MQTPLEMHEVHLAEVTDACVDPWFSEQLRKCRAGDQDAKSRICGSCLRLVLDIVKEKCRSERWERKVDLVQGANWLLVQTLRRFDGSTAREFVDQLQHRVTLFIEHPRDL